VREAVITNPEACILCSACVKSCPTKARAWDYPWIVRAAKWLSTDYRERKEPETYL
jgi:ferredoxin